MPSEVLLLSEPLFLREDSNEKNAWTLLWLEPIQPDLR